MLQAVNAMSSGTVDRKAVSTLDKWESIILKLVMLGPLFGLLFPPEVYFDPQAATLGFTVSGAMGASHESTTALATHIMTLFTLFLVVRHRLAYLRSLKYCTLILLQFAYVLISIAWSPDAHISLREYYHISLMLTIAIYISHRYSATEFIGLLTSLFAICGVLCMLSVVLLPQYSHSVGLVGYESAYRGLFINKNNLGAMCASGVAFSAYSLLIRANSRPVSLLCLCCSLVLVKLSHSATSQILVLFALAVLGVVYCLRSGSLGRGFLLIGFLSFIFLAAAVVATVDDPLQLLGRSSTLTGRTNVWAAVIPLIGAKPLFGWGYGFWQFDILAKNNVWAQLDWAAPHAHNDVLDILLQIGFAGFSVFALNFFSCLFMSLRRIRHVEDGSVMCLLFMLMFVIEGLTEALSLTDPARNTFILFCIQIYIWKLAFPPKALPVQLRGRFPNSVPAMS